VVDSRCESKKAERAVGAIAGIKGVTNEIKALWRSVIPLLAP
jgi:osmotically-inducible protein OsmY